MLFGGSCLTIRCTRPAWRNLSSALSPPPSGHGPQVSGLRPQGIIIITVTIVVVTSKGGVNPKRNDLTKGIIISNIIVIIIMSPPELLGAPLAAPSMDVVSLRHRAGVLG